MRLNFYIVLFSLETCKSTRQEKTIQVQQQWMQLSIFTGMTIILFLFIVNLSLFALGIKSHQALAYTHRRETL
jgi:hypothetical protein